MPRQGAEPYITAGLIQHSIVDISMFMSQLSQQTWHAEFEAAATPQTRLFGCQAQAGGLRCRCAKGLQQT